MDSKTQQIAVGFKNSEALAKAEQTLRAQGVSGFTTESPVELGNVPKQRRPSSQPGIPAAAALGGVAGAAMGAFISAVATNIPNLPSVEGSPTQLFVLVPLGGALLGVIASSLLALLSGANPKEPDFAYYKLIVEAESAQEAQKIADTLLAAEGRLL